MLHRTPRAKPIFLVVFLTSVALSTPAPAAEYVVMISVDGLGSIWLDPLLQTNQVPNLQRFVTEGATTLNARTDYNSTVTLPNHVTMVTARGIYGVGDNSHTWNNNSDPSTDPANSRYSIQNNKGSYLAGVFDVAHDNGLNTAMYATKSKFSLFNQSYNNSNGAPDPIPPDNGLNKIDRYDYSGSSSVLSHFMSDMTNVSTRRNLSFVHFGDPDGAGHTHGWGSDAYNNVVISIDGYIGQILNLVTTDPELAGKTSVILTADHGGYETDHGDPTDYHNYEIPFFVWGPAVTAGSDLYAINPTTRLDPGFGSTGTRPSFSAAVQPIRNGDGANLALGMLELGPIVGSTINSDQSLVVPEPSTIMLVMTGLLVLAFYARTSIVDTGL